MTRHTPVTVYHHSTPYPNTTHTPCSALQPGHHLPSSKGKLANANRKDQECYPSPHHPEDRTPWVPGAASRCTSQRLGNACSAARLCWTGCRLVLLGLIPGPASKKPGKKRIRELCTARVSYPAVSNARRVHSACLGRTGATETQNMSVCCRMQLPKLWLSPWPTAGTGDK